MISPSFLIIPDSFKDCLAADKVGYYLEKGIKNIAPGANTKIIPIADGGEGTVKSIINILEGRIINCEVLDPIGRKTIGFIGYIDESKTAIIEMAAASGIEKLLFEERNPWITSTFGTGQLIKRALDEGCRHIIIGIGGSASNDGGTGMAKALGVKFLDANKHEINEGGGALQDLHYIDTTSIDQRIAQVKITVACDVSSPLTGPSGASFVYGPQKGADNEMVEKLDRNLIRLSMLIKKQLSINVDNIEGTGAAGGLGAGIYAFLNGEIKPGLQTIVELIGLEEKIKEYDVIITAEGKVDGQTAAGKVPVGVGRIASKYKKPVFVFTGFAAEEIGELYKNGITAVCSITRKPTDLKTALSLAPKWLEKSSEELCKILFAGYGLKG